MTVVVLIINMCFRRWLSAGQMGLLWSLVLVRLAFPLALESRLSLESLLPINDSTEAATVAAPATVAPQSVSASEVRPKGVLEASVAAKNAWTLSDWAGVIFTAIPIVWLAGAAGGLGATLLRYVRFCRHVNQHAESADARLSELLSQCRKKAGVKRGVRLVQFDGVDQPAIMGVFRPALLLPTHASELDDERLQMVMLHELAHVRGWDAAVNWTLVLLRVIHWWNPVYWLAASRFRSLREQACDAFVMRRLTDCPSHEYGSLLLTLAERQRVGSPWRVMLPASILSFFPFSFERQTIKNRLKALRRATIAHGWLHTCVFMTFLLLLTVSGFTGASEKEPVPVDLPTWMASHPDAILATKRSYEVKEVYEGPRVTREYDVSKCLEQIAKVETLSNADTRKWLESALKLLFCQADRTGKNAVGIVPLTYTLRDSTLSATAPESLHNELQRLFDAWSKGGPIQISVATRILSANRDLVSELGISWQFLEALTSEHEAAYPVTNPNGLPAVRAEAKVEKYLPLMVATVNKEQAAQLLELAQSDARTNVLNAPKITVFNGECAKIADCVERPFVVGVFQRYPGVNEPKIVELREGTTIKVRTTQYDDGRKLRLEACLDVRGMGDVTLASAPYRGTSVSIQVPSINRLNIDVNADVENGHALLVGSIPTGGQQKYTYYMLSAERLDVHSWGDSASKWSKLNVPGEVSRHR